MENIKSDFFKETDGEIYADTLRSAIDGLYDVVRNGLVDGAGAHLTFYELDKLAESRVIGAVYARFREKKATRKY